MTSEDNETLADPGRTLTDLPSTNPKSKGDALPAESTLGKVERDREGATDSDLEKTGGVAPEANVLKGLPAGRKNILLLCFCLAMFSKSVDKHHYPY